MRTIFAALIVMVLVPFSSSAQSSRVETALARVDKAAAVMKVYAELGTENLPIELAKKAIAIAVFPGVGQKATFLARSSKGRGVLVRRNSDGSWGTASYLRMKAGRPEFTPTLLWKNSEVDIVFLFMDERGMELIHGYLWGNPKVIHEKLAIGPVVKGKGAAAAVESAWVLYYTFEDGKLSGQEFHNNRFGSNTQLQHDDDNNRAIYHQSFKEMLRSGMPAENLSGELTTFQQFMKDKFNDH